MAGRRISGATHHQAPVGGGNDRLSPAEHVPNPPMQGAVKPPPPPQDWMPPTDTPPQPVVDSSGPPEEEVELSPEEQLMFASLLTCGRRSKTVNIYDHTVVVQTLCADDDLRIGLFAKNYMGSLGEHRAFQVGVAAAGIRSIDGKPFVPSLFEQGHEDALFDEKVAKVTKMYPTTINRIYRAVLEAEKEFVELTERLGKSSG